MLRFFLMVAAALTIIASRQIAPPPTTAGAHGEARAWLTYHTQAVNYQEANEGLAGSIVLANVTGANRAAQTIKSCSDGKTVLTVYLSTNSLVKPVDVINEGITLHQQPETMGLTTASGTLAAISGNVINLPCAATAGLAGVITQTAP